MGHVGPFLDSSGSQLELLDPRSPGFCAWNFEKIVFEEGYPNMKILLLSQVLTLSVSSQFFLGTLFDFGAH